MTTIDSDFSGSSLRARVHEDIASDQLRSDVNFLGTALGNIVSELEGEEMFALVEDVRQLTKELRELEGSGEWKKSERLRAVLQEKLGELDLADAEKLLRAFTVYFQLINAAEELQRVRMNRLRESQASSEKPRSESVAAAIKALKDDGWRYEQVRKFVDELDIKLTITAHPTEVKRQTTRIKLERIAKNLRQLSDEKLSPQAYRGREQAIYAGIATLWQTRELFDRKPTVLDEMKSAHHYFEHSILKATPKIMLDIDDALSVYYPEEHSSKTFLSPVIGFRSWIGGDRDGNPFVEPEVTEQAYVAQSQLAMKTYLSDLDRMVQNLSQWQERLDLDDEFKARFEELSTILGDADRFDEEPYRRYLQLLHRCLESELELTQTEKNERLEDAFGYPDSINGYVSDLLKLEDSLWQTKGKRAAEAFVRPNVYRAAAFQFHLTALDIREHSKIHEIAVADLLAYAGISSDYKDLDEDARIALLETELCNKRPLAPEGADLVYETTRALSFLQVFKQVQKRFGEEATGSYIVSMTEGVSDILEPMLLAKQAGLTAIDAVPLFETVQDLQNGPAVLDRLFNIPCYKAHVDMRGLQEVMIGYSDSNKDAGFLSANWALYQAQEEIAKVCKKHGIPLRIFHGRGTSIGRGGGPAGKAILAQPAGSVGGRMRITEQGEALSERYGDIDLAHRHLEQVTHAFILSSAKEASEAAQIPDSYRAVMHEAGERGKTFYRSLLEADNFLDFYHTVTPIEEISRLKIGSRPARRKGERSLDNLRAIPWVFSWTQCRANLPGWFSLGTGFENTDIELLKEMYQEWAFFKALIDFAQMSLAKADMGVLASYFALVTDDIKEQFWPIIFEEYQKSVAMIESITGKALLADDTTLARGITLRNPYVDPISYLQVELLQRLRSLSSTESNIESEQEKEDNKQEERKELESAVLISLIGVAAGMRNTG